MILPQPSSDISIAALLSVADRSGQTPLHVAVNMKNVPVARELLNQVRRWCKGVCEEWRGD